MLLVKVITVVRMLKAEKKLIKINLKAQKCLTREKAQKLIKKAHKQHQKVFISDF